MSAPLPRVALVRPVHERGRTLASRLARALEGAGHAPAIVDARPLSIGEDLLRRRGFTPGLTRVPALVRILRSGDYDVAHAFDPADALAARAWRRTGGGAVVFTCAETPTRERLSDRRLRLRLLAAAVEESDGLTAPDGDARAALWRWMAADAAILADDDAEAYAALYRSTAVSSAP